MKNYLEEAAVTCSDQWHGDLLNFITLIKSLEVAIDALREIDRIKKLLFYGKGQYEISIDKHMGDCSALPKRSNANLIHGILGMSTEAGELLEALYWQLVSAKPFDETNIIEEIGDCQWYEAILARTLKTTFNEIQQKNIAKLRLRYPDKFNERDAINRDLEAERQTLEA